MKKQVHLALIILFLIIANLILVFQYRSTLRKDRMKAEEENVILSNTLVNAELANRAWATSVSIPPRKIPIECLGALSSDNILVVRLSDKQCSSCVDQLLFEIRKHLTDIGSDNLIVIYSSKKDHYINQQFRVRLLKPVEFIEIPDSLEVTPLDQFRIPYLFIVNGNGYVQASFLPYPANDKLTGVFLNHIANQFHNSYEE